MLTIPPHPICPSVPPPPCCCASSSSPSSSSSSSSGSRHAGGSRLHWWAANSRNGSTATASLSLRLDLPADTRWRRRRRRRRQSCGWSSASLPPSCCKASHGGGINDGGSREIFDWRDPNDDDEFLQASLLVSVQKLSDTTICGSRVFLRRQNGIRLVRYFLFLFRQMVPKLMLGEFAIERLIDTLRDDKDEGSQNQFKFINNLVGTLDYEIKMVRITKRVINTYYARIFLGKPAEGATLSVDSRPSDAINVAIQCQAPIYVSKDIVMKDAIRIVYGAWRGNGVKTVYDVSLDSATEGPDVLSEELDLIRKMNTAVVEERYNDAAMWRDKLMKLRVNRHDF